jgi:hypothetical protein
MDMRINRLRHRAAVVLSVGTLASALAIVGVVSAQVVPSLPPIPTVPTPSAAPLTPPSFAPSEHIALGTPCVPTPDNHNCAPPPVCCSNPSVGPDGLGFVPVGADPAALAELGIALSPALNLNPPINYPGALNVLATCTPWGSKHLASSGLTHVEFLFMNGGVGSGNDYSADFWAFATFPGTAWGSTTGGTAFELWFVNASTGDCLGASQGLAPSARTTNGVDAGNLKPAPGQFEPY